MTTTAIVNARVFDGECVLPQTTVVIDGARITAVGGAVPEGADIVDAGGGTLLPGLVDAHVHTSAPALAVALRFGVTTELEMQGTHTRDNRAHIAGDDTVADVRSSGFGITRPADTPTNCSPRASGRDPAGSGRRGAFRRTAGEAAVHHSRGSGRGRPAARRGGVGLHQVHDRRRHGRATPACPCLTGPRWRPESPRPTGTGC